MNPLTTFYKIFPTLSKGTRALFIFLFNHQRKHKGNSYPSQDFISTCIKLSIRQIRRATQRLCELGWLGIFAKHRKSHRYFIPDELADLKFDRSGMPQKILLSSPKMSAKNPQNVRSFNINLSLDKCFTPPKEEPHFEKAKANRQSDLELSPHLRRVGGMNLQQLGFLSNRYQQAAIMCALESMEAKKRKGENIRSPFGYLYNAAKKISNDYGYALRRF